MVHVHSLIFLVRSTNTYGTCTTIPRVRVLSIYTAYRYRNTKPLLVHVHVPVGAPTTSHGWAPTRKLKLTRTAVHVQKCCCACRSSHTGSHVDVTCSVLPSVQVCRHINQPLRMCVSSWRWRLHATRLAWHGWPAISLHVHYTCIHLCPTLSSC